MPTPAIQVEHLSKRFRLGEAAPYHRFSELLAGFATAPWRLARKSLRQLRQNPFPTPASPPGSAASAAVSPATASEPQPETGYQKPETDELWALRDVSFDVQPGEVLGIIGRNGAGKSTLLKILARITEPTEGRALIRGRVGSLLEVGTGFHPELTGRENIYLNGAILGMTRREIRAKFDEIVAFAEIERFLDTPVKHYSSGMYMRLAFAVAAHLDPEILVVDEVLAVGDAQFQKKCLGKMQDVAQGGRTVLFVSHNMGAIRNLCKGVLLLENGRQVGQGPTAEIVESYLSRAKVSASSTVDDECAKFVSDDLSLINISTRGGSGEFRTHFLTDEPITVEIAYEIHRQLHGCRVGILFNSLDGTLLFEDYDNDALGTTTTRYRGVYKSVCDVPANFLRPGGYTVDVNIGIPNVRSICYLPNAAQLVVEAGSSAHRPSLGNCRGLVMSPLDWRIKRCG